MPKDSAMNKEITLTPQGGRFYRAMTFHWITVAVLMPPLALVMLLAVVNPLWFRDAMFNFVERKTNQITRWRNYIKYKIYLGTDPKLWHSLKGDMNE
jgi:hypothetical protein